MFGEDVRDEITSNIIGVSGYPKVLSILMTIFIAIIPLTKLPLNARPIVSTIEVLTGLDAQVISDSQSLTGLTSWTRGMLRATLRVIVILIFVIFAIIFPAFDSIIAFMGSALCFTICVILPLLFHLKLFGKKISTVERIINYVLIIFCLILATVGTIFAFLPKSLIGAD
jgi:solute carrier family 32 (vesicular inhibitory amino acid transporter)